MGVMKRTIMWLRSRQMTICGREFLEKLLRRKQGYLLTAFLNQAAHPMQNACLGLFLADRARGIKLIVKRNISRSCCYFKARMGMRWTLKLHVRAWM